MSGEVLKISHFTLLNKPLLQQQQRQQNNQAIKWPKKPPGNKRKKSNLFIYQAPKHTTKKQRNGYVRIKCFCKYNKKSNK